jgi:hypothetical protein
MNADDPNFFTLLILSGAVLYGLMPAYGVAVLILAMLWVLAKAPLLFFALAGIWLLRWFVALVAGLGFGLGFGRATRPRYPRRRPWTQASLDRYDDEGRRGPPRALTRREPSYQPFDDGLDHLGE